MAEEIDDCNRENAGRPICVKMELSPAKIAVRTRSWRGPRHNICSNAPVFTCDVALNANCPKAVDRTMPMTSDELLDFLVSNGIAAKTVTHPPLSTVTESQMLRGQIAGGHTKNLFLKDKKSRYFLVTVEEDATVDLKGVHQIIGASGRVSFGSADAMMSMLGVSPGAVTLFGVINDRDHEVTVVVDSALMEEDTINAHPLVNTATTSIARPDLLRFFKLTGHEPLVLKVSA